MPNPDDNRVVIELRPGLTTLSMFHDGKEYAVGYDGEYTPAEALKSVARHARQVIRRADADCPSHTALSAKQRETILPAYQAALPLLEGLVST